MSYHRGVARDTAGNSLNGASVTVLEPGTTTESSLFSEETLTTPLDNPITTGVDGVYEFYILPGYYDIQVAKSGFTTVTLENQTVGVPFGSITSTVAGSAAVTGPADALDNTFGNLEWGEDYASNAFSVTAADRLQYDGLSTVWANIQVTLVMRATTGANGLTFQVYTTGPVLAGGSVDYIWTAANYDRVITWSVRAQLSPGDEIYVEALMSVGSETYTVQTGSSISATILG